jgi:tetratricopeptide (TPR) repeat protein
VFLAQDVSLGRKVALKLLPAEFTGNEDRLRRFRQEARAASALNHPNILTIYEISSEDGTHFMATEYVEGETLRRHMAGGAMKLGEVLDVGIQAASALAAAHEAGIVHRDIKPENIMVRRDGYAKVLDFGLAKLTERAATASGSAGPTLAKVETNPGIVMGTAQYMSPEQARGLAVDARTDIFSLGVVLYEMVAGRPPFEGGTMSDVIVSLLDKEPAPLSRYSPEVPAELQRIVGKSLCKDREGRYQGVKDLLIDLKSLRDELAFASKLERSASPEISGGAGASGAARPSVPTGRVEEAHPTSSAEYIVTEIKRHKRGAALALAALVMAIAASAYFYSHRARPLTERDAILLADFVNTTGDPVFDGTLKQALAVQLGQSPFLNLFPEDRVRETLSYMGRSPDERVTKQIAREICQRQGIKALLTGSIAGLGSHYVITLEALNSQTGEAIAREQVEAESKEQVLKVLGGAATKLREKLGESVSSIQKFDAPVEQATTSSLEALKAFTLGNEMLSAGRSFDAIPFFKRSVELDPDFALAYLKLGGAHYDIWKDDLAAEYAERAFELRGRTSEREQLYISNFYYAITTGEIDKSIEVLELWKQTYPRDIKARTNLTDRYAATGQYDKAAEEAGEALRLDPNVATAYSDLGIIFLCLNRFDEARAIFELAVEKKLDSYWLPPHFYMVAFVQGDEATMQRQVDWANGKPSEGLLHYVQAHAAAFSGQRRKSQDLFRRSKEANERYGLKEGAAWGQADYALLNAAFGDCQQTKEGTVNALNIVRSKQALMLGGVALALCGETSRAQSLASELVKRYPKDTLVNTTWLPMIQAALEINRGNTEQAIQLLQVARRFEMEFLGRAWAAYVRGLAYLRAGAGAEAMAEFQMILDHRGVVAIYASFPLAHLGLARAVALTGDTAKSRKAYQDFFALWKDADPDLPILIEAKKEYQKLR